MCLKYLRKSSVETEVDVHLVHKTDPSKEYLRGKCSKLRSSLHKCYMHHL